MKSYSIHVIAPAPMGSNEGVATSKTPHPHAQAQAMLGAIPMKKTAATKKLRAVLPDNRCPSDIRFINQPRRAHWVRRILRPRTPRFTGNRPKCMKGACLGERLGRRRIGSFGESELQNWNVLGNCFIENDLRTKI